MYKLKNMLLQEQKHLEKIVMQAKTNLSTEPEGHLRISIDQNKPRYYQCINDSKGIYIPRDEKELPRRLAQKGYNEAVIKKGETRLKQIKKITKNYSDDEIEKIFNTEEIKKENALKYITAMLTEVGREAQMRIKTE